MSDTIVFMARRSVEQVEEGTDLAPKFDEHGLIPVVTTDYGTGEVLMHAYMNAEALAETIRTGEAVYWSRSRKCLWRKGATSGLVQKVRELRIDDDQDAVWLRVEVAGCGARPARTRRHAGVSPWPEYGLPATSVLLPEPDRVSMALRMR